MKKVLETAEDVFAAFGVDDMSEPGGEHEHVFSQAAAPEQQESSSAPVSGLLASATTRKPLAPTPPATPSLSRSYEVKGILIDTIALRAPRGVDFWEVGEIVDWIPTADGQQAPVDSLPAIRAYAERCVQAPAGLNSIDVIEALNLADTIALRNSIVRFFEAPEAGSA